MTTDAPEELNTILVVDDRAEPALALPFKQRGAVVLVRDPGEVDIDDLEQADLVLADYVLDDWLPNGAAAAQPGDADRPDRAPVHWPRNGLAMVSVFRERIAAGPHGRYTSFAIHTGALGDLAMRSRVPSKLPHLISRLGDLEWVFEKDDRNKAEQVVQLASATRELNKRWPAADQDADGYAKAAHELLSLPTDLPWADRARDDLILCRAPLSGRAGDADGIVFLRWLLHEILPYPTFLLPPEWVATRLGVSRQDLDSIVRGDTPLARDLEKFRYEGIAKGFQGPRWWSAGLEDYLWNLRSTSGNGGLSDTLATLADGKASVDIRGDRVVCIDGDFRPETAAIPIEEAVRLVPDMWPAYASPVHARISLAQEDAAVRHSVHPLDRDKLGR